jgi:hypothetical protein
MIIGIKTTLKMIEYVFGRKIPHFRIITQPTSKFEVFGYMSFLKWEPERLYFDVKLKLLKSSFRSIHWIKYLSFDFISVVKISKNRLIYISFHSIWHNFCNSKKICKLSIFLYFGTNIKSKDKYLIHWIDLKELFKSFNLTSK